MAHVILPTHTCFDDSLDLICDRVRDVPALARSRHLRLVHGIALMPLYQPDAGRPFAHAWVEEAGYCYTFGLMNGERVMVREARDSFYARLRVRVTTRYTVHQAYLENVRTGHYGPWLEMYLQYVRTPADRAAVGASNP